MNPNYNVFYSQVQGYVSYDQLAQKQEENIDEEFAARRKSCEAEFSELKVTYLDLFQYEGIKKAQSGKTYTPMIAVQMEEIAVVSTKDHPYLGTDCLGVCIAVMARGYSETNGSYIALSHTSSFVYEPEELLIEISRQLQAKGCNSIEFYVVGGQLPYIDGPEIADSIDRQSEFLSLSKQYNIVGAQFNLAEGADSLAVIISADEIVWQRELDSEDSSDDSSSSTNETSSLESDDNLSFTGVVIAEKKRKIEANAENLQDQVKRKRQEYAVENASGKGHELK